MSTKAILIVGGAVALVVGVLVFRGAQKNPTADIGTNLINGAGKLTRAQTTQIVLNPQSRSGRGHF